MNAQHQFELGELHFGESLVAQDAGVVDENVDASPARLRGLDHRGDLRGIGDIGAIGDGDAAGRLDFARHLERGLRRLAVAAEIVDDDLGAARGQAQSVTAAEAAAGAGDDGDPSVEPYRHLAAALA